MIPNFGDRYGAEELIAPEDAVAEQGDGLPDVPPAVIVGFQPELTDAVEARAEDSVRIVRSQYLYQLTDQAGYVPVHEWGIGAPVAATVVENVIAAGAEAVVQLSGGAGIQPDIDPETALLPTSSIRDEGVSYHYVPDGEAVTPSADLVETLGEALSEDGFDTRRGPTWTTSAFYRETVPEIGRYRDDGVLTLDTAAAAIRAVCRYRGADTATC